MKIHSHGGQPSPHLVSGAQATKGAAKASQTKPTSVESAIKTQETEVSEFLAHLETEPAIRSDKVNEARQKYASGEYLTTESAKNVAEALLGES